MKPIVITSGDPAGVGPEVALKAMASLTNHPPIILIGPSAICTDTRLASIECSLQPFDAHNLKKNTHYFLESSTETSIEMGEHTKKNGAIAYQAIQTAVELIQTYNYQHLVTAPISKRGLIESGHAFSGHTPLLAHLFKADSVSMAFYSPPLTIVLASVHIPLSTVEASLTKESLIQTIHHAHLFAQELGILSPKIALSGLNPHAGEYGQIGTFEQRILPPILSEFPTILGPFSPDTIFRDAVNGQYDIVIALYHDQGLIPVKLLAFDSAVNVTIGLPICRTSPDHGTAYDIAYTNQANPASMTHAIQYCINTQ